MVNCYRFANTFSKLLFSRGAARHIPMFVYRDQSKEYGYGDGLALTRRIPTRRFRLP